MKTVEINNLVKSYSGKKAVDDLSFSVVPGEILGLIGPNGAGKSTTIKTILGFIQPDSGNVKVFGNSLNEEVKNNIGYLPEERGVYKKLAAVDLIVYLATLKGMDSHTAEKNADVLLERTGMLSNRKMKMEDMSKGMGQIIQLIITIVHEPELIILDEPFSGLDPVNTALLKNILVDLKNTGKSIILSTHQMNEVEEICNRVLMIHKGRSVLYGDLKEIKSQYKGNSVYINTDKKPGELRGVTKVRAHKNGMELILDENTVHQDILHQLMEQKITINKFELSSPSLNELFIKIVGSNEE